MKYLFIILVVLVVVGIAVYYYVPFIRYVLIPLTGGTQEPVHEDDLFPPGNVWINSEPLRLSDLKKEGNYILIDFWTYTCINCIRGNPHTQELWERYKDYGLMIIGVHSPEFTSIEADPKNVERAVLKAGMTYPIIVDRDMKIWNSFGNRFWPAKYLINPQGRIVHFQFGEGNYDTEEQKIRAELTKAGHNLPIYKDTKKFLTPISKSTTAELYAGLAFLRKPFGNKQQPKRAEAVKFTLPDTLADDQIYLSGTWVGAHDFIESASDGEIVLSYRASTPYIVLAPKDEPLTVEVLLDGAPLSDSIRGEDISERDGKTVMQINEPRLYYPLSSTAPYGRHTIIFKVPSGVQLFSFTFGAY